MKVALLMPFGAPGRHVEYAGQPVSGLRAEAAGLQLDSPEDVDVHDPQGPVPVLHVVGLIQLQPIQTHQHLPIGTTPDGQARGDITGGDSRKLLHAPEHVFAQLREPPDLFPGEDPGRPGNDVLQESEGSGLDNEGRQGDDVPGQGDGHPGCVRGGDDDPCVEGLSPSQGLHPEGVGPYRDLGKEERSVRCGECAAAVLQ